MASADDDASSILEGGFAEDEEYEYEADASADEASSEAASMMVEAERCEELVH